MQTSTDPWRGCVHLSYPKPIRGASCPRAALVTLDNLRSITCPPCLPYQLSMVHSAPTMVTDDNGESGFDSREGA
uniref:Uncharacterized protein n=1 Tax=Denticeps clupeoides TaxID=299321 RepID=A0AAY4E2J5_9TELE